MKRSILLLVVLLAACEREGPPPTSDKGAGAKAAGPVYRIDVPDPPPCKAGSDCQVRVQLHALSGFKINREYPFKFVADETPGVAHQGKGDFAFDDDKTGTLTVTVRPEAAGTAKVAGTFKLSVCSEEQCEIEAEKVAVDLTVQ